MATAADTLVESLVGDLSAVRAPRGSELHCKGWHQEAALRMLCNNLDPEVAEDPTRLVVYGGSGRAARSHEALRAIVAALLELESDETLLVQSGKPVGVFRTHPGAPRVLIANSLLVPRFANWDEFRRLEAEGLTMFGQMTAGSWIYIGTQGILQGTYQTFAAAGEAHWGSPDLAGRTILTAGLAGWAARSRSRPRSRAPPACASRSTPTGSSAGSRPATWTRSRTTSTTPSPGCSATRPRAAASRSGCWGTPPTCSATCTAAASASTSSPTRRRPTTC
jgi:hypothetical protein